MSKPELNHGFSIPLNQFLKEHRTVQQQQREIAALKPELKEQRVLIRKVSEEVELKQAYFQKLVSNGGNCGDVAVVLVSSSAAIFVR